MLIKSEITEAEYDFMSEENKALYAKQYYRDFNISTSGERNFVKCDEAIYNRHNHPYRKWEYELITNGESIKYL